MKKLIEDVEAASRFMLLGAFVVEMCKLRGLPTAPQRFMELLKRPNLPDDVCSSLANKMAKIVSSVPQP